MVEYRQLKIDEMGDVTVVCFREYFISGVTEIEQLARNCTGWSRRRTARSW